MEMTSNQPYLYRAVYEWILDNGATPYILVNAQGADVKVPTQSVKDGQIILNIAPRAVSAYEASNEAISFTARFNGVPENIYIPMAHILAIYAAENGQGMVFSQADESFMSEPEADQTTSDTPVSESAQNPRPKGKPDLKVIK